MKIALIQTDPQPGTPEANLEAGLRGIRQAADGAADWCVLPEMWSRCFADDITKADQQQTSQSTESWQQACADAGINCIGGVPILENGTWKNAALAINSSGEIVHRYDKLHLFSYMGEEKKYRGGDTVPDPLNDEDWSLAISICYDLRFPELYRQQRLLGAHVLIVIAQWPTARYAHWRTLIEARAIENQCYVIAVNRCGRVSTSNGDIHYPGRSTIIDPWGDTVIELGSRFETGIAEISLDRLHDVRRSMSCWADRRLGLESPDA